MPVYFDDDQSQCPASLTIIPTRYPPHGLRSWGPTRALILEAGPPEANKYVKAFAMIETAEAIKNLDAILDVEGLDGVFVGNTPPCHSTFGILLILFRPVRPLNIAGN